MRIYFKQINQQPQPLNIENNISGEDLIKLLTTELNFPHGIYTFCFSGKILDFNHPLINVPDDSIVVCSIKRNIKPLKQIKQIQTYHFDIPPNHNELLKAAEKIKTNSSVTTNFREFQNAEKEAIKSCISTLQLEKLYSTSFRDHPKEMDQGHTN